MKNPDLCTRSGPLKARRSRLVRDLKSYGQGVCHRAKEFIERSRARVGRAKSPFTQALVTRSIILIKACRDPVQKFLCITPEQQLEVFRVIEHRSVETPESSFTSKKDFDSLVRATQFWCSYGREIEKVSLPNYTYNDCLK